MQHLQGKAIVVTGAGRGIGEAYARGVAALGGAVVVNDIDLQTAKKVAEDIAAQGGRAVAHGANVSRAAEADDLIATCVSHFGAIDGLVNNASLLRFGRLEVSEEDDFRAMIEANLMGTYNCSRAAIRRMYAQKRGSIVNVTSGAQTGLAGMGAYGATKGAVASFTYTWAQEAAGKGVRVNAISPYGKTRMMADTNSYYETVGTKLPTPQTIAPESNVPVVTYLLSDLSNDITGQIVRMTGNKLSLMTHPAIRLPIIEEDQWTIEAVSEVFKDTLAELQLPPKLAVLDVKGVTITVA